MRLLTHGIRIMAMTALMASAAAASGGGKSGGEQSAENSGPPTFHSLPETRTPASTRPLNRTGTAIMKKEILAEEGKLEEQRKARKRELILEKYREMVGPDEASRLFPRPDTPEHDGNRKTSGSSSDTVPVKQANVVDKVERRRQVQRQVEAAFGAAGAKKVTIREGDDSAIVKIDCEDDACALARGR